MTVTFWTVALALAAAAVIMARQSVAEQKLESKITWRNRAPHGRALAIPARGFSYPTEPNLAQRVNQGHSLPAWVERRRRTYGR